MYKFLLILLAAHSIVCQQTPACSGPPKTPAALCNQYYECVFVLWYWDYKLMTCSTGQVFNSLTSTCVTSSTCLPDSTTTTPAPVTTTTTAAPPSTTLATTTAESTTQNAETTTVATTTVETTTVDSTTIETTTAESTTEETESTSTVPSTTTSQCSDGALTPAAQCNEYYECVFALWYWDYKLMTCPTGQVFDPNSLECTTSDECITDNSTTISDE